MKIKGAIRQEDITHVNFYAPIIRVPKYVKQILMDMKGETDRNTVIAGDFNIPLTSVNRTSRNNVNEEIAALNQTLDQMDLIDIFRAFHPKASEYTGSSKSKACLSGVGRVVIWV